MLDLSGFYENVDKEAVGRRDHQIYGWASSRKVPLPATSTAPVFAPPNCQTSVTPESHVTPGSALVLQQEQPLSTVPPARERWSRNSALVFSRPVAPTLDPPTPILAAAVAELVFGDIFHRLRLELQGPEAAAAVGAALRTKYGKPCGG